MKKLNLIFGVLFLSAFLAGTTPVVAQTAEPGTTQTTRDDDDDDDDTGKWGLLGLIGLAGLLGLRRKDDDRIRTDDRTRPTVNR